MSQVASTIIQQIGTDAWLAVSARNAYSTTVNGSEGVRFQFGSAYGLRKFITVLYDRASDTYSVEAVKVKRNFDTVQISEVPCVTWESLGWIVRDINNQAS